MSEENNKKINETASYTNYDAVRKAIELATPIEEKSKIRRRAIFENAATVISAFAILLTITLYSYNRGYSHVFGIPVGCMPLDLTRFVPVAILLGSIFMYILFYIVLLKTDNAMKKKTFNLLRVFYGFLIIWHLLSANHINNFLGSIWSIVLPLSISLLIELLVFISKRSRKEKKISEIEYIFRVEDYLFDRFLFSWFTTLGICIIVIIIITAEFLGGISAKANLDYQTCFYNDQQFSVIVDYGDKVLVQQAKEDNNTLTICTSDYTFISKENLVFVFKKYDLVEIVNELPKNEESLINNEELLIEVVQ